MTASAAREERRDSANPTALSHNQQAIADLVRALAKIRYGQVGLTIHDGRIVQLDVTEKKRFSG